jgi:hypothetical protein
MAASTRVNAMTPEEEARQEIDRLLEAALEQFKSIYEELGKESGNNIHIRNE